MNNLKFRIHPLFFIFGIYFAFTGKVFSFLVFTLVAVEHEFGHYLASEKLGYKLQKITLMPYGAIIKGDVEEIKLKDQIKIAIAGPLINLITSVFFIAVWWVFPDVYPYTDIIVYAGASIAIVNLMPCYPLDGGRILYSTLCIIFNKKTAKIIVVVLGVVFSLVFLAAFVYSCFTEVNFTILFFSAFIIFGLFFGSEDNKYIRTFSGYNFNKKKCPLEVKRVVLNQNALVKELFKIVDVNAYYEIEILDDFGKKIAILYGEELIDVLTTKDIYTPLKNAIK